MKRKTLGAALGLIALVQLSTGAVAAPITLTMDEVASQPIDGLTVSKGGMNFTFSSPANLLSYNSVSPGTLTYIQGASIQGTRSAFSVAFSAPVTSISFGLAELNFAPLFGASVTLSDGTALLFDLLLVDPFAEGQFSWTGSPVTGFSLTPAPGGAALAFDNLRVDAVSVPEPVTLSLFGAGLAGAAAMRRRKKKVA
jgi:hypothetical protein